MTNQDPGGWHPAPDRPGYQRYWDGTQWTEHYAPLQADATQQGPAATDATAAYATAPPGVGGGAAPVGGAYGAPPPGPPQGTPSKGGAAKILIPVAACVVLAIVAVVVGVILTSGDDDSADATTTTEEVEPEPSTTDEATTTDEPATTEEATTTDDAPTTTAGSGTASGTYEAGRYTFSDVQVLQDFVDDFEVRAQMTNNGADVAGASLTVSILSGGSVVGTGTGFATNVASGATVTVEFISVDDFVEWDSVEFQVDSEF